MHKNTDALFDASKEIGLEEYPEKTKYMLYHFIRRLKKSTAYV
jgi:hypothetical protein